MLRNLLGVVPTFEPKAVLDSVARLDDTVSKVCPEFSKVVSLSGSGVVLGAMMEQENNVCSYVSLSFYHLLSKY